MDLFKISQNWAILIESFVIFGYKINKNDLHPHGLQDFFQISEENFTVSLHLYIFSVVICARFALCCSLQTRSFNQFRNF